MDVNAFMEHLFVAVGYVLFAIIVLLLVYAAHLALTEHRAFVRRARQDALDERRRPPLHVVRMPRERDGAG